MNTKVESFLNNTLSEVDNLTAGLDDMLDSGYYSKETTWIIHQMLEKEKEIKNNIEATEDLICEQDPDLQDDIDAYVYGIKKELKELRELAEERSQESEIDLFGRRY